MPLTMQENPRQGAAVPMSDAEWAQRVQLAACYRIFASGGAPSLLLQ